MENEGTDQEYLHFRGDIRGEEKLCRKPKVEERCISDKFGEPHTARISKISPRHIHVRLHFKWWEKIKHANEISHEERRLGKMNSQNSRVDVRRMMENYIHPIGKLQNLWSSTRNSISHT